MNIKKGIVYIFVANAISLLASLFAGFVLPKLLSIETYSDIKLFQLYVTYLGILHLGYSDGMYLRHGGRTIDVVNKKEINAEFKTFKIFQFMISVVAVLVAIALQNKILLLCALVIVPVNSGNYLRNLYQATGEFKKYSRLTNISTLLIFAINVILLFIIKSNNPIVFIVAYVVAYYIYWLFLEIENTKIFGRESDKPDKKFLISDIKTGIFLMTGNFCNVIFTSIDRLFVERLMGKIEFAIYSFAVGIENLVSVFINPISTVLYNYFCNNNGVERVKRIKRAVFLFGALLLAFVYPSRFIVVHWLTNYVSSINIIMFLFAAQFASIMIRCVHINLYKSQKKQNRYFFIMVAIVLLSIVLDALAYYLFGSMEAIAIATLITNVVWFIVGEVDLRKYALGIREYLYYLAIIITFLITIAIESVILGMVVYLIVLMVATVLLLPDSFKFAIEEISKLKKKVFKKRNEE